MRVIVYAVSPWIYQYCWPLDTGSPSTFVYQYAVRFFTRTALMGGYLMSENEFTRSVSVDGVPRGSRCEWCGKPAEVQLTAIGGLSHNDSGLFCRSCGEDFTRAVINISSMRPSVDATL